MKIKELHLKNFRGYAEHDFKFHDNLTLFVGENGSGKTGVLEGLCVALGGWLYGFEGIDSQDKRNIRKADRRVVKAGVNGALLEQMPVEVSCVAQLADVDPVAWERCINNRNGRTTHSGLYALLQYTFDLNKSIYSGQDENINLPLVAYYSSARLWNEPIVHERKARKDKVRLEGYKGSLSFTNSIKDAMNAVDRIAYLAYRDEDVRSKAIMDAMLEAIRIMLSPASPNANVNYNMKDAEIYVQADDGEIVPYSRLSDGYRCIVSLVIDLCRRAVMLNPQFGADAVKRANGVVLIDEIDLHIHPKWQQKILGDLQTIFPEVQFVMTTHAPAVIQSVKAENLVILDGENTSQPKKGIYGRDVNSILADIMGVNPRPDEISKRFKEIYTDIDTGDIRLARAKTEELERIV
ncbi:MAG: AAA family ATPase, partial [Spirochaetia bacterium]|nr:AAA family ATPase [Spirochaetia bacterium]